MPFRIPSSLCAAAVAVTALGLTLSAPAVSAKSAIQTECSAKYQAAKAANTLNGQTYNQFYKQCAAEAKAAGGTAPAAPTTPAAAPAAPAAPAKPVEAAVPPANPAVKLPPAAAAAAGSPVFPSAVSPSLASEKPGKQRFETCLAQYHANEATNANGGLKWIQKGGGYYSECNKKLKGA